MDEYCGQHDRSFSWNIGQGCKGNLFSLRWVPTAVLWRAWEDRRGFAAGQMSQFTEGQTSEAPRLTSAPAAAKLI